MTRRGERNYILSAAFIIALFPLPSDASSYFIDDFETITGKFLSIANQAPNRMAAQEEQPDNSSPTGEKSRPSDAVEIQFLDLQGVIRSVDGDQIVISLSGKDGIAKGMQFSVYRDGTWMGSLEAVEAMSESTLCRPLTGERRDGIWNFVAGDLIKQRVDVMGKAKQRDIYLQERTLSWQKNQKKFDEQINDISLKIRELYLSITTADDPSERVRIGNFLKVSLNKKLKIELDFLRWLKDTINQEADLSAGNKHLLAEVELLKSTENIASQLSRFSSQEISARLELLETFEIDRPIIEQKQALIKQKLDSFNKHVPTIYKYRYDEIMREKSNLEKEISAFSVEYNAYKIQILSLLDEMKQLEHISGKWKSTGEVSEFFKEKNRREMRDRSLYAVNSALAEGKYAKAQSIISDLEKLSENISEKRAVTDAREHARVLELIAARNPTLRKGFSPPLSVDWSVSLDAELLGQMRFEAGRVFGVCRRQNGYAIRAWDATTGRIAWETALASRPFSDWLFLADRIVVVTEGPSFNVISVSDGSLKTISNTAGDTKADQGEGYIAAVGSIVYYAENQLSKNKLPCAIIWGSDIDTSSFLFFKKLENTSITDLKQFDDVLLAWVLSANCTSSLANEPDYDAVINKPLLAIYNNDNPPLQVSCETPHALALLYSRDQLTQVIQFPEKAEPSSLSSSTESLYLGMVAEGKEDYYNAHILEYTKNGGNTRWRRLSLEGRKDFSQAYVDHGTIYFLLHDGLVVAADQETLEYKWITEVAVPDDGNVFLSRFINVEGESLVLQCGPLIPPWRIYVINKSDGAVTAHTTVNFKIRGIPVYRNGILYAAAVEGTIHAIDMDTEQKVWSLNIPDELPAIYLSAFPKDLYIAKRSGLESIPEIFRKRVICRNGYSPGMPGFTQPLLMTNEFLVYYRQRDKRLIAFRGP